MRFPHYCGEIGKILAKLDGFDFWKAYFSSVSLLTLFSKQANQFREKCVNLYFSIQILIYKSQNWRPLNRPYVKG